MAGYQGKVAVGRRVAEALIAGLLGQGEWRDPPGARVHWPAVAGAVAEDAPAPMLLIECDCLTDIQIPVSRRVMEGMRLQG